MVKSVCLSRLSHYNESFEPFTSREVNENVFEKAEALQDYISQTEGTIIFKLAVKIDQPDPVMTISPYIKAYFSYRPDR